MFAKHQPQFRMLMAAAGILLLIAGALINYKARKSGINDYCFVYNLSKMLVHGRNAYDPNLPDQANIVSGCPVSYNYQPYPPSSGMVLLPLALLSPSAASLLYFVLLTAIYLGGLWAMMSAIAQESHTGGRLLVLGLAFCVSSTRWVFLSLQSPLLTIGFFGFFYAALIKKQFGLAAIWTFLCLAFKFTNALPFLGLLLFHRQYRSVGAVLALFAALNMIGFARMGGSEAVDGFRRNLGLVESLAVGVNYPDPRLPQSFERMDWVYLLNAVRPMLSINGKIAVLLSGLTIFWIWRECRKIDPAAVKQSTLAAVTVPLLCLSLLFSYHHYYEAGIFVPALILYFFTADRTERLPGVLWFAVVAVPYILYPRGAASSLTSLGETAILTIKVLGSIVATIALLISLRILHIAADSDSTSQRTPAAP